MAEDDYERVLCVKNEAFVFRIPPRATNRGYRAADWKLDQPDWTGRLRVCSKANDLYIKLEDNTSGELFANCPVDAHPGIAVESVTDSSRYFVLRIKDDGGRHAFIGMGFQDRGDSFDFNVSLQDHFKRLKQEQDQQTSKPDSTPKLDLGFKEGQTIRINFGNKTATAQSNKAKAEGGGNIGILPPPPGGTMAPKLTPPSGDGSRQVASSTSSNNMFPSQAAPPLNVPPSNVPPSNVPPSNVPPSNVPSDWGDFASASASQQATQDGSWVQF